MDPKLLAYMEQHSKQQTDEDNPIESGTLSGMQAAKQSVGLDEAQKARARGMAFMTLGHHLAQPGYGKGTAGTLRAFTSGLLPSAQAYESSAQQSEALNVHLMKQQQMEQLKRFQLEQQARLLQDKMAQRAQEQEALQQHRGAQLEEMRGYHQGRLGLEEKKLAEKAGIFPGMENMPGIPLASLTTANKTAEHKIFNEHKSAIKKNEKSIHILDEIQKIFNQYPDIGDSYAHLNNDESIVGKTIRKFMPKDKLSAIQKLNKLGNELIFEKVKGMPARGMNMFIEKKIAQAVASGESTKDAADFVINEMRDSANESNNYSNNYVYGYQRGYIPFVEEKQKAEIAPATTPETPMAQSGTVRMQTPDGKTWSIPLDKVETARARGAIEIGQ
jgi:hypothetical protein